MKNIETFYPLSPLQKGLLFHTAFAPELTLYFQQMSCAIDGEFDAAAWKQAWRQAIDRHSTLRTSFLWEDLEEPVQIVHRRLDLPVEERDWRDAPAKEQSRRLEDFLAWDRSRGFSLNQAPLMRMALLRCGERKHYFVWSHHHLLLDGWSVQLLLKEVFRRYEAEKRGQELIWDSPRPYRDYIVWLQKQDLKEAERYWRKRLEGIERATPLPLSGLVRPADEESSYAKEFHEFTEADTTRMQSFARQRRLTMNTILQGAWGLLLSRYSGEKDVVFGATVSGRSGQFAGVEEMLGLFINTLPVRVAVRKRQEVANWLRDLQDQQAEARQYEYTPLLEAQRWSGIDRGHQLFESLMIFQNYPTNRSTEGMEINLIQAYERTNYPLSIMVSAGRTLEMELTYDSHRFERESILRIIEHFSALLKEITVDPDRPVAELFTLGEAERRRIIEEWNATEKPYPIDQCLHHLFDAQAAISPDHEALVFENERLTYKELNQRANQLARLLRKLGAGPETLVAVCFERSLDMVVALLGALKAGAAYVPLDPTYPAERLAYMIEDAGASLLLTQERLLGTLPGVAARVICLDRDRKEIESESPDNPSSSVGPQNLAYMIYTSGSTGRPKGAMNTHRAICNRLIWMQDEYRLGSADRVLQKTPFSFDVSVWEFFWPLMTGATLVVAKPGGHQDSSYLREIINQEKITTIHFVPSMLQSFVEEEGVESCVSLKRVICSGEALPASLVAKFQGKLPSGLHNLYGPTEAAVDVTSWACEENPERAPIGRPIANVKTYILDEGMNPTPIGVAAELYLGGVCLGRGYHGKADLTAERFVPSPYSQDPGARLYRTGDLARYLPDGNIEFLGRIDHQVKIRGFRIELGEIESALNAHEQVGQAMVNVREDGPGDKRLVAYVVGNAEQPPTPADLRRYLRERLPEYMVPSAFVTLEKFPLTPSGKIDRRALPAPERIVAESVESYVAPRTPTEELLCGVWAEVLKIERVGINDNFFDLGGHSLLAMKVASQVRRALGLEVPLRMLFESQTVAALAESLDQLKAVDGEREVQGIERAPRGGPLPLSFGQLRLWFLDRLEPGSAAYNVPDAVRLNGRLDVEALERSLNEIVRRHESLRTRFDEVEGEPAQIIDDFEPMKLEVEDLSELNAEGRITELQRRLEAEAAQAFDLTQGPVMRVRLFRLAAEEHALALTFHHIISDEWSIGALIRELSALYGAYSRGQESPLEEAPIQYADYAAWQRRRLDGGELDEQIAYWKRQLSGAPGSLEIPTDYPRPVMQTYRGGSARATLGLETLEKLRELSRREGATLFMTALACFQSLLSRYSGQEEIVIGTPVAGRTRRELEGLIGFFVNTLALRVDISGNPGFRELIGRAREVCLEAYTNEEAPFERVVEELGVERDLSRTPIFQAMLAVERAEEDGLKLEGLEIGDLEWEENHEGGVAKFDLSLTLIEKEEGLEVDLNYNLDLYEEKTARQMTESLCRLIEAVAEDGDLRLSEIPLLSEAERVRIIEEWNATEREYPIERRVHQLFEEQAARSPEAPAVIHKSSRVSYRELNERANQLAHYLRGLGVGAETPVGLFVERGPEMIVGLLGILKAGAAYLPLDPAYPRERLEYMLADAGSRLVLTNKSLASEFKSERGNLKLVCLDSDWKKIAKESRANPIAAATADNSAYIIYTSGTTGKPKGVVVSNRGMLNYIVAAGEEFALDSRDRLLQFASLSFDIATEEIFTTLSRGATLVLRTDEMLGSATAFLSACGELGITALDLPTAYWHQIARQAADEALSLPPSLRLVIIGGERALPEMVASWQRFAGGSVRLLNTYGPTEATIVATMWEAPADYVSQRREIPIGKPIANMQAYVLDGNYNPLPAGAPGELYLGGEGIARGYFNRAELTAERFIPNPWGMRGGERLYRTGDRARWLSDGNIEYLGREDGQVKIRGFRIELGEIELRLCEHEQVREAVVKAHEEETGGRRLVAYVVGDAEQPPTPADLRQYLRERLPEYMVPSAFVTLEKFQLTPSGKIDRRALTAPEQAEFTAMKYIPPRDVLEIELVKIFEEALNVSPIGLTDNFFELGGHSLLALRVCNLIERHLGSRPHVATIFQNATVEELAAVLRRDGNSTSRASLVNIRPQGNERPLFFVHGAGGGASTYVELANRLEMDRPLYAFQPRGLYDDMAPHTNIQAMAADYLAELRVVQPQGPYLLGGWSMGGVVAFEMAHQLEKIGEQVELLTLIDSFNPSVCGWLETTDDETLLGDFALDIGLSSSHLNGAISTLSGSGNGASLAYLFELAIRVKALPADIGLPDFDRLFNVYKSNVRALREYSPATLYSPILLFKASENPDSQGPAEGWEKLAAAGMEIQEAPGNHFSILHAHGAQVLAKQLKLSLAKPS